MNLEIKNESNSPYPLNNKTINYPSKYNNTDIENVSNDSNHLIIAIIIGGCFLLSVGTYFITSDLIDSHNDLYVLNNLDLSGISYSESSTGEDNL